MEHCTLERSAAEKFTSLYRTHKRKVYDYAMLLTQSQFQSEEIVQEVFLKIWINRHQLDLIDNFNGWLYTIARNKTLDCLRMISREQAAYKELRLHHDFCTRITEEMIRQKEYQKLLHLAIEKLPSGRRKIYQLIRIYGWKREEAAHALDISVHTVKSQLSIAIRQIKAYFQAQIV